MDSKFEIVLDEIKEKLMATVTEFSDYEAAESAFSANKAALALYNDIIDRKQTLAILEAQGLPIEPRRLPIIYRIALAFHFLQVVVAAVRL